MMKVHFDAFAEPHPICEIEFEGSMAVMLSDTSFVLSHMYNSLKRHDPSAAEIFKSELRRGVTDPNSPVFKDLPLDIFDVTVGSFEVKR